MKAAGLATVGMLDSAFLGEANERPVATEAGMSDLIESLLGTVRVAVRVRQRQIHPSDNRKERMK